MNHSWFWLRAINTASVYAAKAHDGQFRKDGVTPYVIHPARVASLVTQFNGPATSIIAAWFHDIVEDCPGTHPEEDYIIPALEKMAICPNSYAWNEILASVRFMTKDMSISDKEQRENEFLTRLAGATEDEGLIKICDRVDNLLDTHTCNSITPQWTRHYVRGSVSLLNALPRGTRLRYPQAVDLLAGLIKEKSLEEL